MPSNAAFMPNNRSSPMAARISDRSITRCSSGCHNGCSRPAARAAAAGLQG
ncbi:hypothetical protein [Roseicella sp. DB1501]|uniref:hypothetical protein n=1 Tax=Roseicella sp. DB1501 TaxID=2730925 RepID=UPI0038D1F3B9